MLEFFEKLRKDRERRKNKYWKLKQSNRMEHMFHSYLINKSSEDTLYFISIPLSFIKYFTIALALGLLTSIAVPELNPLLLKLFFIFYKIFIEIVIIGILFGFFADMLNLYLKNKKFKGLNQRFGLT